MVRWVEIVYKRHPPGGSLAQAHSTHANENADLALGFELLPVLLEGVLLRGSYLLEQLQLLELVTQ